MFLDNNSLLKAAFHDKRTHSDFLHINSFGYSALVKCIKTALFGAKAKKSLETGRQHSSAAWGNPRHQQPKMTVLHKEKCDSCLKSICLGQSITE